MAKEVTASGLCICVCVCGCLPASTVCIINSYSQAVSINHEKYPQGKVKDKSPLQTMWPTSLPPNR